MTFFGRLRDIKRERKIKRLSRELATCAPDDRGDVWDRLKREINSRTPGQVARMEKRKRID